MGWPVPVEACSSRHVKCYFDIERNILLVVVVMSNIESPNPWYVDSDVHLYGSGKGRCGTVRLPYDSNACLAMVVDENELISSVAVKIKPSAREFFPRVTLTSDNYYSDEHIASMLLDQCSDRRGRSVLAHLLSESAAIPTRE